MIFWAEEGFQWTEIRLGIWDEIVQSFGKKVEGIKTKWGNAK